MQCRDLKELLSAYADGELSRTQKEFVEEHLAGCADCRATLEGYRAVNQKLTTLRKTPTMSDIKGSTMSSIKGKRMRKPIQRWLRPSLAIIPVAVILIAIMIIQPWIPGPQTVMAKAYAAVERLQSYKIWREYTIVTYKGEVSKIISESDFMAPDRYHIKTIQGEQQNEAILLDKRLFIKSGSMSKDMVTALMVTSSTFLTKETTLNIFNELINIEKLPDEKIDGVECFHYRGTLDMNKESEQIKSGLDPSDPNYERLLADAEQMRLMNHDVELWIGKEDYLVRQIAQSYQRPATSHKFLPEEAGQRSSYTSIMKFFDLNKSITISPFATTGDLLPGWEEVSNSSFS